ncbi:Patatin, putative [Hondaea fermentalgiana]|uniref:Patatin, putative n=1 Tax=Hondaea fermentalgiana TaxID=2315210 RepID=A0A2R5GL53_9STRA|nr:Patatin, putative [Hondaea fermentalgiana]|eukprot:GBG31600.1 Patatin, putative [Hondaea fermentalgiana]
MASAMRHRRGGAASEAGAEEGGANSNSGGQEAAEGGPGGTAGTVIKFWRRLETPAKPLEEMRERMLRELTRSRARVGSVTDNAWANLNEEYARIVELKEELTASVRRRQEYMREELHHIHQEARVKARNVRATLVHYLQLILVVGPVVACVVYVCREHPWLLAAGIVYFFCLCVYLLYVLVVPTNPHRGVRWFKPYELGPEECASITKCIHNADKRLLEASPQGMWTEEDKDKPLFIISLDGGGIRGAVTARILDRISEEFPDFMDHVGLVAGCSTGSIVGGMLATGFSPAETLEMFRTASPLVFRKTVWGQLKQLGMLTGPNHDGEETTYSGHHGFDDAYDDVLDEDTLANLQAHMKEFSVEDLPLADIVNGATAAPFYFPAFKDFVDGGLWSNDPSMAALALVAPHRDLAKVHMLSVSTGMSDTNTACRVGHWGVKQWLPWFIDFLFFATSKAAQFNCKAILGDRYHRVDPTLSSPVVLNDVGALDELVAAADACDLEPTFRFLDRMGLKRRL